MSMSPAHEEVFAFSEAARHAMKSVMLFPSSNGYTLMYDPGYRPEWPGVRVGEICLYRRELRSTLVLRVDNWRSGEYEQYPLDSPVLAVNILALYGYTIDDGDDVTRLVELVELADVDESR